MTIRRLTYADLPQVIAIERRAFPAPWSLAMFVLELSKPAGVCLAAVEDKTLKGYLVCSRYDIVWHLMNVAVDPPLQGHGVGSRLLTEMLRAIDGEGADGKVARATLEVRQSNAAAIRLYERFGFLPAGIRRRYYQDNGEDAVIMWRTPATLQGRLDDIPAGGPGAAQQVILAIETSCDDTCAALVTHEGEIRANVISSQGIHDRYGGVVPEVASRHHLELANVAVDDALRRAEATLDDVDLVAVTQGPGLVGALLVGVATAKGIAAARGLPLAPVDHLQGHVAANFLRSGTGSVFEPPFLCLIASGGHTFLADVTELDGFTVLGQTLDDAAGEAFDKGARLLGLPYPGGPHLEKLAREGDPAAFDFPTGRGVAGLDFSFAGLKTALLYKVRDFGEGEAPLADLAASYQLAIVESLARRCEQALEQTGRTRLAIGGGVAANGPLRERMAGLGAELSVPPRELCTDNAAMIASAARYVPPLAFPAYLGLDAYATGERGL